MTCYIYQNNDNREKNLFCRNFNNCLLPTPYYLLLKPAYQFPSLAECGIRIVRKINYYHSLLGYLYADTGVDKAIDLTKSISEKKTLMKEIGRLNKEKNSNGKF